MQLLQDSTSPLQEQLSSEIGAQHINYILMRLTNDCRDPREIQKLRHLSLHYITLLNGSVSNIEVEYPLNSFHKKFLNMLYSEFMRQQKPEFQNIVQEIENILHKPIKSSKLALPKKSDVFAHVKQFDYQDEFKGFICPNPFIYGELRKNGDIATCCYLPFSLGNVNQQPLDEIWKSEKVQELRRSILSGEYTYCDKSRCGGMQKAVEKGGKKPPTYQTAYEVFDEKELKEQKLDWITTQEAPKVPDFVSFEDDPTCNLSCPSCRKESIVIPRKQADKLIENENKILEHVNSGIAEFWLCGAGDPFISRPYRKMLKEFDPEKTPDLNFRLDTNGVLLTEKTWNNVVNNAKDNISLLAVSIDATTEEVYAETRRGGNFKQLMQNLVFMAKIPQRKTGMQFIIRMIVQQKKLSPNA
jgi:MoaA/NifB/PqqE/SkfB family radical SAM enzyme